MNVITIYSKQKTARLVYVLDWLFKEILHADYVITGEENEAVNIPFCLSYGNIFENAISIPDAGLLWEKDISVQGFEIGFWENIPTVYHQENKTTLPFDIFSAIFFLIARYEEYYGFVADKHGRYPVEESIFFKNSWLERPLVDEWIFNFFLLLKQNNFPVSLAEFSFQPTYDIDIAYSYLHKGRKRTIGAFAKDFLKGSFQAITERSLVLQKKKRDPFDCFDWLRELHKQHNIQPVYFVLVALEATSFDKNNDPKSEAMKILISDFAKESVVGLHPSYFSNNAVVFETERQTLEEISLRQIEKSRQHYIRLKIPKTYYHLLDQNIKEDYSMGYGSVLGFRAGTGRDFLWYDLKNEQQTSLRIFPFCFMDSTALFEQKLSVEKAFQKLNEMREILIKTNSQMITVFHNFSLGTDGQWEGWKNQYEEFLNRMPTEIST